MKLFYNRDEGGTNGHNINDGTREVAEISDTLTADEAAKLGRLFAAAPELLEAAKDAEEWLRQNARTYEVAENLRAAISETENV